MCPQHLARPRGQSGRLRVCGRSTHPLHDVLPAAKLPKYPKLSSVRNRRRAGTAGAQDVAEGVGRRVPHVTDRTARTAATPVSGRAKTTRRRRRRKEIPLGDGPLGRSGLREPPKALTAPADRHARPVDQSGVSADSVGPESLVGADRSMSSSAAAQLANRFRASCEGDPGSAVYVRRLWPASAPVGRPRKAGQGPRRLGDEELHTGGVDPDVVGGPAATGLLTTGGQDRRPRRLEEHERPADRRPRELGGDLAYDDTTARKGARMLPPPR